MLANLANPFNSFLRGLAMIFALSGIFQILLILPFLVLHKILTKLTGWISVKFVICPTT